MILSVKDTWLSNVRGDMLAGTVVALALIPEAIAFSIIAGVDPKVGLYASFCIAVVTAFLGGRPGMISAATGAMALLMITLVKDHGLQYLLAATLLTGVFQNRRGLSETWLLDAVCLALRGDGLCQCAGHPHFHGAITRIDQCHLACLRHDGAWSGDYLWSALSYQSDSLTVGDDCCPDHHRHGSQS